LPACPLTIHALLHIADSIRAAGPVWTAWAFPMERYCGSLLPAIKSRRFPWASLDGFVLDSARLAHIMNLYRAHEALSLKPAKKRPVGAVIIPEYDSCLLLPKRSQMKLVPGLREQIVNTLSTWFRAIKPDVRRALPPEVQEWAKMRILPDGDTMRAATSGVEQDDARDTTWVRYELNVDRNRSFANRPIDLEERTYFGQLQHVLVVNIGAIPSAVPPVPATTLLLGVIKMCKIEEKHPSLDIHYYKDLGRTHIVDMSTVQCVVGRVSDRGRHGIIDRSGPLARAEFVS
ncbi:uncharacterized protein BXZ73DRAFT_51623, partial [Epithele typhae]|uniref:uncharacterized protein n=1 Tax=Epithele typhae TaxID=378194 RepID=UPI002007A7D1